MRFFEPGWFIVRFFRASLVRHRRRLPIRKRNMRRSQAGSQGKAEATGRQSLMLEGDD